MKAVVAVYRGDQEENVTLEQGQLTIIDDTYSVRLVEMQP